MMDVSQMIERCYFCSSEIGYCIVDDGSSFVSLQD